LNEYGRNEVKKSIDLIKKDLNSAIDPFEIKRSQTCLIL